MDELKTLISAIDYNFALPMLVSLAAFAHTFYQSRSSRRITAREKRTQFLDEVTQLELLQSQHYRVVSDINDISTDLILKNEIVSFNIDIDDLMKDEKRNHDAIAQLPDLTIEQLEDLRPSIHRVTEYTKSMLAHATSYRDKLKAYVKTRTYRERLLVDLTP